MKIFKSIYKLQKEIFNQKKVSFVPTMGGFHKGHISLVKKSRNYQNKILVSIFVNPKQFNNKTDFNNYPRNIKLDLHLLKKLKVDFVFLPSQNEIFSFKTKNSVYLDKFSKKLCGKYRKGHFEGVLNVVNRFLEIISPKYMFLGAKDFQQLHLIKKHINKNKIKTTIISCKTIREKNGVACSTRNKNLNKQQIKIASNIYKYLYRAKKNNFMNKNEIKKKILSFGAKKIDYIEFYNLKSLKVLKKKGKNLQIFIAYYVNNTRLIDNI